MNLHEYLYFDRGYGDWAIRNGKWKLHNNRSGNLELIDLSQDISKKTNLIKQHPEIANMLQEKYKAWKEPLPQKLKKLKKKSK